MYPILIKIENLMAELSLLILDLRLCSMKDQSVIPCLCVAECNNCDWSVSLVESHFFLWTACFFVGKSTVKK